MKWNKVVGALIFLLTSGCLVISIFMTRQSGISSAATTEGKQLLGWASVIIHLGMPIFGIASGAFNSKGFKGIGRGCTVLVFLCALFSVNNVLNFVAAERTSVAREQARKEKAKDKREQAILDAAKERQNTINKMAQDQIAWTRGTEKTAGDRRERKDSIEASSKFLTEFAKTEIAVPTIPDTTATNEPVVVQSEDGARMISEWTGWNVSTLQLSGTLQTVLMLIVFEAFGWTIAAYLWFLDSMAPIASAAATMAFAAPAAVMAPKASKLLAPPPKREKVLTIRTEPTAEWRALLDEVDYPPAGSRHKGPPRPKDKREHVAPRLLVWLQAYSETGEITTDDLTSLYEDYNHADHRIPWGDRIVKSELEGLGKKFASKNGTKSPTCYSIPVQTPEKVRSLLEKRGVLTVQSDIKSEPDLSEPEVAPEPEDTSDKKSVVAFPAFWRKQATGLH